MSASAMQGGHKKVSPFHYSCLHVSLATANAIIFYLCYFCFFFGPQIFWHPWNRFCETLPHDMVCCETNYVLWGCSYVAL